MQRTEQFILIRLRIKFNFNYINHIQFVEVLFSIRKLYQNIIHCFNTKFEIKTFISNQVNQGTQKNHWSFKSKSSNHNINQDQKTQINQAFNQKSLMQQQSYLMTSSDNQFQKQPILLRELKERIKELVKVLKQKTGQNISLKKQFSKTLQKKQFYQKQKQLQDKKYKSLNLLVQQLENSYQSIALQQNSQSLHLNQNKQAPYSLQNYIMRHQLIKLSEICKQSQKLSSFLKQLQANKSNLNNFISKSHYIQNQLEVLSKLKSQINLFRNQNYQCRRKWSSFQQNKLHNQTNSNIYQLQDQRQKSLLKDLFQTYLEKTNQSKSKIVNFNQTQKQKFITQYLVGEISFTQQNRTEIEEQNRNLNYHLENLNVQLERLTLQNNQFNSFFMNDNRNQQSKLALKMRTRIEQLRDTLIQIRHKSSSNCTLKKTQQNLSYLRQCYQKHTEQNNLAQMNLQNMCLGKYPACSQQSISQFFTSILSQQQQKQSIQTDRINNMKDQLKQIKGKVMMAQQQVQNVEHILGMHDYQAEYNRSVI